MKRLAVFLCAAGALLSLSGCSLNVNLDLLGTDTLQEVVLLPSAAKEKILMVDVSGVITAGGDGGFLQRGKDPTAMVYAQLSLASKDRSVRGVILRLDTPGGEVTASDMIRHEILQYKKKTGVPVTALMMSVAASGGYYIACAADRIIAHPTTLTGSIGVVALFPETAVLLDKLGLRVNVIKSGDLKDAGSVFRKMTDDERAFFRSLIEEDYRTFLEVVAAGRAGRLTPEDIRGLADGRVFTGRQALELKLVDAVGYFDAALDAALEMARLKSAKIVAYTHYPKTKTNIYAAALDGGFFQERRDWTQVLTGLRSGRYYLWLPPAFRS
ncbi:MAG: signal peptide peptidase SppA [Candidatus Aminicenantes bacterium]|nr:signal peptide peptidase SppA [Candidatus Aminicenantes bacterium]